MRRLPGWIDRADREAVLFDGSLMLSDGSTVPVRITNVSDAGCQLECEATLPIGGTARLQLGENELMANIRWALPGSAGLQFLEPVSR